MAAAQPPDFRRNGKMVVEREHVPRQEPDLFRRQPQRSRASRHSKISVIPALVSAALRAVIHSSVNFAGSDDGVPFEKSAHTASKTSCRLNSALLYFSWSSLQAPASLSAFTAPLCTGTAQFLVCVFTASPLAPGALSL